MAPLIREDLDQKNEEEEEEEEAEKQHQNNKHTRTHTYCVKQTCGIASLFEIVDFNASAFDI